VLTVSSVSRTPILSVLECFDRATLIERLDPWRRTANVPPGVPGDLRSPVFDRDASRPGTVAVRSRCRRSCVVSKCVPDRSTGTRILVLGFIGSVTRRCRRLHGSVARGLPVPFAVRATGNVARVSRRADRFGAFGGRRRDRFGRTRTTAARERASGRRTPSRASTEPGGRSTDRPGDTTAREHRYDLGASDASGTRTSGASRPTAAPSSTRRTWRSVPRP
jgi:hypothetical protein